MKAEELNGTHLGSFVHVIDKHITVEGTLTHVEHTADLVEDYTLGANPITTAPSIGQRRVDLRVARGTLTVRPEATVEVCLP